MAFEAKPSTNKTIVACQHCGSYFTQLSGGLCSACKTPEKRAKMDAENTAIFAERKLVFNCPFCNREKKAAKMHEEFIKEK